MTRRWAVALNMQKEHVDRTEMILRLSVVSAESEDEARGKAVQSAMAVNAGFAVSDIVLMEITPCLTVRPTNTPS